MKQRNNRKIILPILMFLITLTILFGVRMRAATEYSINNKQDFLDLLLTDNADMEGSYSLKANLDFTSGNVTYRGESYVLGPEGLIVAPIGERKEAKGGPSQSAYHNPFLGTFNGGDFSIRGLVIRSLATENEYVGLFGYNKGIISNLGFSDSLVEGGVHVGGIAGYNLGSIVGTYNSATIKGIASVGGITGTNYGYVRSSYNIGYVGGATKIGGIVGQNSKVVSAVYDLGIISGELSDEGQKEYGYIYGYNSNQGVIGYVENDSGFINLNNQNYAYAGAYYSNEYNIGVGMNLGYDDNGTTKYDNVATYAKSLDELQDIYTYDPGFINPITNINPEGSSYTHYTTGFMIGGGFGYNYPVTAIPKSSIVNTKFVNTFEGAGTIFDPYIIKEEEDFNNINLSLTSAYKLDENLVLSNSFLPLASETETFDGIFNGNGKRIRYTIDTADAIDNLGLFSFNAGIIHNLSVSVDISAENAKKVGAIVGFNTGEIYEVYSIGNIIANQTVGGLVGVNQTGKISNSFTDIYIRANLDVGGIAGFNNGTIDKVYVANNPMYIDAGQNLGAIIGYNDNLIANNVVNKALFYDGEQIGYQSSLNHGYSNESDRVVNVEAFEDISSFATFSISEIARGASANTIWAIEPGVNNNRAYLVGTQPFRVESISLDASKPFIYNGTSIRIFDDSDTLLLDIEETTYAYAVNLNDYILISPLSAENKNLIWQIISGSEIVHLSNGVIYGLDVGSAVIRVMSDDGGKILDINVLVSTAYEEIFIVDEEGNVLPDEIEVENFSSFYLHPESDPQGIDASFIVWEIPSNDFLQVLGGNQFRINYDSSTNPVINNVYSNPVECIIKITNINNSSLTKEIKIKVIPSNKKIEDNTVKIYEGGNLLELELIAGIYYLKDSREVNLDSEYLSLVLNDEYTQSFVVDSEKIIIDHDTSLSKKLYVDRGDIVDGEYTNRLREVTIKVTSEDKTSETFSFMLKKALSSNTELDDVSISLDGVNPLVVDRVASKFIITGKLAFDTEYLYITPSLLDNKPDYAKSYTHSFAYFRDGIKISDDGEVPLEDNFGTRSISLVVYAEDGTSEEYYIEYEFEYSKVATLKDLFIGYLGDSNKIIYNPLTNNYNITLDGTTSTDLYLNASPWTDDNDDALGRVRLKLNSSAFIESNTLSFPLDYGESATVLVYVQSEYDYQNDIENYNIYQIEISRDLCSLANLESLSVNGNSIAILNTMNTSLANEVMLASIALTASPNASVSLVYSSFTSLDGEETSKNITINPSGGLYRLTLDESGTYKVSIAITAQDNSTNKTYILEIEKLASSDSAFYNINIDGTDYDPLDTNLFNYDLLTNTYTLKTSIAVVYEKTESILIGTIHDRAYYEINYDRYWSLDEAILSLNTGNNQIEAIVYAEDDSFTTYIFTIARGYNPNTAYTVEHYFQALNDSYVLDSTKTQTLYGLANSSITATELEILGFTFDDGIIGTVKSGIIAEDGTLVLKLYYTRDLFTLSFIATNGAIIGPSGSIKYGASVSLEAQADAAYNFDKWYVDDVLVSSTATYSFNMPASDYEVEARFTAIVYEITYHLYGGLNNPLNVLTYTIEDLDVNLYDPSKELYNFVAWYLNASYSGDSVDKITMANLGDINLYARFVEKEFTTYKITHYIEALDGTYEVEEIENKTAEVGEAVVAIDIAIAGFTYEASLSTSSGVATTDPILSLELYYTRNKYELKITNANPSYGNVQTFTDNVYFGTTHNLEAESYVGYNFVGWFIDDVLISDLDEYIFTMPAKDVEIVAKFGIRVYEITYHLDNSTNNASNPATYTINDLDISLANPSKTGYTFLGWYPSLESEEKITSISLANIGNIVLYAKFEAIDYEINLYIDSILVDTLLVAYDQAISFPSYTNNGYSLDAWYEDASLLLAWYDLALVKGDLDLYAKWDIVTYTITYHFDGGSLEDGKTNPTTYTIESVIASLNPAIKDAYDFVAWSDDEGNVVDEISNRFGDLDLYAQYTIKQYTITISVEGQGTITVDDVEYIKNTLVVDHGEDALFKFIAALDFVLESFTVDGVEYIEVSEYNFTSVTTDHTISVKFVGSEPKVLSLKDNSGFGNKVYEIDREGEVNLFLDYYLGQEVASIRHSFLNSPSRIKFFNASLDELSDEDILGTGSIIRLYNAELSEVIDEVIIVLTGDVDGNGYIDVFDVTAILSHIKGDVIITEQAILKSADANYDGFVEIFDVTTVLLHVKTEVMLYD